MIAYICLLWLGVKNNAQTWYYVILGIAIFIKFIKYTLDVYKIGKEN